MFSSSTFSLKGCTAEDGVLACGAFSTKFSAPSSGDAVYTRSKKHSLRVEFVSVYQGA